MSPRPARFNSRFNLLGLRIRVGGQCPPVPSPGSATGNPSVFHESILILRGRDLPSFEQLYSCFHHIVFFISLVPKASIIARKKEAAAEKLQEAMDEVADCDFMK